MKLKACSKCKIEKPLSEFFKDSNAKCGKRSNCKACAKQHTRQYRQANRERILAQMKQYNKANKERISEWNRQYRQANKERISEKKKQWRQDNKEKIKQYEKERRKSDPLFKLGCNARTAVANALKNGGFKKESRTNEILGIDYERYKKYLESKFQKGMSWENQGEWHIDHIIPLASAKTEEELLKLLHYSNTQPLWAEENLRKGARILDKNINR